LGEALLKVVEEICYKMFDCRHSPFFTSTPPAYYAVGVLRFHGNVA